MHVGLPGEMKKPFGQEVITSFLSSYSAAAEQRSHQPTPTCSTINRKRLISDESESTTAAAAAVVVDLFQGKVSRRQIDCCLANANQLGDPISRRYSHHCVGSHTNFWLRVDASLVESWVLLPPVRRNFPNGNFLLLCWSYGRRGTKSSGN